MSHAPAVPVLTIEVERCSASEATVRCHGRLVAGVTNVLTSAVRPLIPECRRIVLDLSDLSHTDSMGLGALVRLYVAAKSAGCSLELMHLSKQIRHLLGLTHMLDIFTVVGEHGVKFM
ncbi:MAG TPA: STAS domain-containing protein [Acidobacteriaceae bacterium]|jgi:anti-sigma B factor antagonist|nr:STAS domain-containing protein [Acidobacteriaceae bacterium]